MASTDGSANMDSFEGIRTVRLSMTDFKVLYRFSNRYVTVSGSLYEGISVGDYTKVLMSVVKIKNDNRTGGHPRCPANREFDLK